LPEVAGRGVFVIVAGALFVACGALAVACGVTGGGPESSTIVRPGSDDAVVAGRARAESRRSPPGGAFPEATAYALTVTPIMAATTTLS
jgi:hypothetical protein